MSLLDSLSLLVWGAVCLALAGVVVAGAIAFPARQNHMRERLEMSRSGGGVLSHTASRATTLVTRAVARRRRAQAWAYALDRAGVKRPLPEVAVILGAAVLAAVAVGLVLNGPLLSALLVVVLLLSAVLTITIRADLRRRRFTDQLDDVLQLLATNLRAGHSLLQAMSSLAADVEEPARSELSRAVNQVAVGRDLGDAIDETSRRMASEDFSWVAQAIGIHRQVGGNLANILENIGVTIRERNQVRRQVRALSGEGRLSAVILMGLPVVVALILSFVNPLYMEFFTGSAIGYAMIGLCLLLMTVGGLWMWRLIQVEY